MPRDINSPSPYLYIFITIVTLVGIVHKLVGIKCGRKYFHVESPTVGLTFLNKGVCVHDFFCKKRSRGSL